MTVIDHEGAPEIVRRPGYRRRPLAGGDDGFELTFEYHIVEPGSGAPPHYHPVDELLVILEGEVEARLGDEVQRVTKNHTIAVSKGAHHSFTVVGREPAKILVFFPVANAFSDKYTTYL
ncbi:MAG: cupin domain-containing protein [Chloroflexi bacterium]|nr:cupin domain-containing protein [Chloroflexota bacterium]